MVSLLSPKCIIRKQLPLPSHTSKPSLSFFALTYALRGIYALKAHTGNSTSEVRGKGTQSAGAWSKVGSGDQHSYQG